MTTIYDGAFPIGTVAKNGRLRVRAGGKNPRWSRVKTVHYLEGGTLTRVSIVSTAEDGSFHAITREIADSARKSQCDDCVRGHRATNKNCSATLGLPSRASKEGFLYHFGSKAPAGRWHKTDAYVRGRVKVGTARYVSA